MNNLSSYCGLVDANIRASDKDLPVPNFSNNLNNSLYRINEGGAEMIDRALNGYQRCAAIATHYRMNDVLDNIVISLCKFTTLTNSGDSPYVFVPHFGANIKALMATKAVFALAHKHGDILSDGWKHLLDCLLWLFKCQLLSKNLVSLTTFMIMNRRTPLQILKK